MNKQVVIRGEEGDWYEKAIFILKQAPPHSTTDLVNKANNIIGNYMKTQPLDQSCLSVRDMTKKKGKWIDLFFYSSIVLFASILVIYLV